MKMVKLSSVHYEMLVELSKKNRMKLDDYLEVLLQEKYNKKKWTLQPTETTKFEVYNFLKKKILQEILVAFK